MNNRGLKAVEVANILKNNFKKEDYGKLTALRVYDRETTCLVFDFSFHGVAVDLVPKKDGIEFQLFQRRPNGFLDQKISDQRISLEDYEKKEDRFIHKYPKDWSLADIVDDAKKRLKNISLVESRLEESM